MKIPFLLILIVSLGALIRIPYLAKFPPSLYSDEVSQGYNAYSILKTGRDEFGTFLPISFRSFGDWKPPLPTYLMIPTIAIFGLNAWGVRIPGAILGTLTLVLSYLVVVELINIYCTKNKTSLIFKNQRPIALLTTFLLAISPWHIMQSRGAMLVGVAFFFSCLSIWTFFKGLRDEKYWYISSVSFVLAIYSYYGMRVVVLLLIVFLAFSFRKIITIHLKTAAANVLLGLLLLIPLGVAYFNEPNVIFGRAKTVSVFYDKGVELTLGDLIKQDNLYVHSGTAKYFHNLTYAYTADIGRRFFQHLDGRFFFLSGDKHPPFQIPGMGVLYIIDGLSLLAGIMFLIKNNNQLFKFILVLIVISVLPAALTFLTPSANRTFTLVLPLMMVIAIGVVVLTEKLGKVKSMAVFMAVYSLSFSYFLYQYIIVLPREHADWWHYGYKELITYLNTQETNYEDVFISGRASVPYIFLLYYTEANPVLVQRSIERDLNDDEFGFEHVTAYRKYQFPRYFKWESDERIIPAGSLLVVTSNEIVGTRAHEIQQINYPNGTVAFRIYEMSK